MYTWMQGFVSTHGIFNHTWTDACVGVCLQYKPTFIEHCLPTKVYSTMNLPTTVLLYCSSDIGKGQKENSKSLFSGISKQCWLIFLISVRKKFLQNFV